MSKTDDKNEAEAGKIDKLSEAEIQKMVDEIPNFDEFTKNNTYIAEELDKKKIFDFTNNNQPKLDTADDFLERIKLIEEFNKQSDSDKRQIIAKLHEIQTDELIESDKIPIVINFIANEKSTYTEGLDLANRKTEMQKSLDKLIQTKVLDYSPQDLAEDVKVKEFNSPEERKAEVKQLQEKLIAINGFERNSEEDKQQIAAKLYGNEFNEEPKPEDINIVIKGLDLRKKSIVKNLEAIDPKGYVSPSQNSYDAALKAIDEETKQLDDEMRRLSLSEERNKLDQEIFNRNNMIKNIDQEINKIEEELKNLEQLANSRKTSSSNEIKQDKANVSSDEVLLPKATTIAGTGSDKIRSNTLIKESNAEETTPTPSEKKSGLFNKLKEWGSKLKEFGAKKISDAKAPKEAPGTPRAEQHDKSNRSH